MRKRVCSVVALSVSLLLCAPSGGASATRTHNLTVSLPAPSGPLIVGVTDIHLHDPTRPEFAGTTGQHRQLMIRVWYPASRRVGAPQPWMAGGGLDEERVFLRNRTVPEDSWSLAPTHSYLKAPAAAAVRRPVLIYSPGFLDSDSWNTSKAEDLASHGYVVVGIDHTHETYSVEFPRDQTIRGVTPKSASAGYLTSVLLPIRVADTRFVLDQLTELTHGFNPDVDHAALPSQLGRSLDLARIGMFGHSLGGSTTAQAMHEDDRISAGIDLDGPLWGSVGHDGLSRPLGMLGNRNQSARTDPDWLPYWPHNTGRKIPLRVPGARHESFTDQEIIISQLRAADLIPASAAAEAIGTCPPARSVVAQNTFLRAFFDTTLIHDVPSPSDVHDLATSGLEPAA
ncbi:alpha/beta hydrolase [Williamsia maris]|uniref:Alpha/beta hydrolase family protein n=1 Tax=Williamsia maris TaxID=72806 RepID=A0ABT1HFI2_9NOCA|nr:Alpha/beta hydrolase family protein [Williamsia maris]